MTKPSKLALCLIASAIATTGCNDKEPPQAAKPQSALEARQEARRQFFENLNKQNQNAMAQLSGPAAAAPSQTRTVVTGGPNSLSAAPTGPAANAFGTPARAAPAAPQLPPQPALDVPADAEWTLVCISLTSPDRFQRMDQMKAYLSARTPLKNWYVLHDDAKSTLFHGFYPSISSKDPAGRQAQADRIVISEWADPGLGGEKPFTQVMFTRIAEPEPPAPAEWRLSNAPNNGYWSLQVAAFQGNAKRKEAAVEAVREMRAKGIEAYYYHGPTISSVCIGAWPENALKAQEADGGKAIVNQEDALLVASGPLGRRFAEARIKNSDGQRVQTLTERVEVQDKSLLAAMRDFPDHSVNYELIKREAKDAAGNKTHVYAPSFLVIIPRESAGILAEQGGGRFMNAKGGGGATADAPATVRPATGSGAGKLRGLGN
ncbi:MAG TPA: hypothetical protein VEA69_18025 [Tepidisphaeraceae bacterium]|nr:hypothetical protein [Tepidisphaeraceae bacterium]